MFISRWQIEREGWIPSVGIPVNKEHFREPPPGTGHAVFDYGFQDGELHYDENNPLAGPVDLVKHLWNWSPVGTLALGYIVFKLLK